MRPQQRVEVRGSKSHVSPRVEVLEERVLLACSIKVRGDSVTVRGDNGPNVVDVLVDETGGTVTCDGVTRDINQAIGRLKINTRGGDDEVFIDASGELADDLSARVDLGSGNDLLDVLVDLVILDDNVDFDVDIDGGDGDDEMNLDFTLDGPADEFEFDIEGDDGEDLITALFNVIFGSDGTDFDASIDGGDDDDEIDVDVTLDGDANDFAFEVEGGDGADVLALLIDDDFASFDDFEAELDGGDDDDEFLVSDNVEVEDAEIAI